MASISRALTRSMFANRATSCIGTSVRTLSINRTMTAINFAKFQNWGRVSTTCVRRFADISKAEMTEALQGKKIVFIVGGPGSGKGTQCDLLVQKYGFCHLSSGDLLRAEVASGSDRGKALQEIMTKGELVPLEMVLAMIKDAMLAASDAHGYLIDGYPRQVAQGQQFESSIAPADAVLFINVAAETMIQRLINRGKTSGRADDNEETIRKRLDTFTKETEPVVAFYKEAGKLMEIPPAIAETAPDAVFGKVCEFFDKL